MRKLPSLFLAHGAPDLPLTDHPAKVFLQRMPETLPEPKAIVLVSAHWASRQISITGAPSPSTIYDFSGWPAELYRTTYPARTDLSTVNLVQDALSTAGIQCAVDPKRGYDHGAWVPMMLSWPEAKIPMIQLSLDKLGDATRHFQIGQALAKLRQEGVLVIGSGASVHNLYALAPEGSPVPLWARNFDAWLAENIEQRNLETLLRFPTDPVEASTAHPTIEHFLPLFVALGAGWDDGGNRRIHHSYSYGSIGMSCFAFGAEQDLPSSDHGEAAA